MDRITAPIRYANVAHLNPGERLELWDYNEPDLRATATVREVDETNRAVIIATTVGEFVLNRDRVDRTGRIGALPPLPPSVRAAIR